MSNDFGLQVKAKCLRDFRIVLTLNSSQVWIYCSHPSIAPSGFLSLLSPHLPLYSLPLYSNAGIMAENQPLLQDKPPMYNPDPGAAPPIQGYAGVPPDYQQGVPPPQGYAPPPQAYAPPPQAYAPPPQAYGPPQYQGAYQNQSATNVTVVQTSAPRMTSGG